MLFEANIVVIHYATGYYSLQGYNDINQHVLNTNESFPFAKWRLVLNVNFSFNKKKVGKNVTYAGKNIICLDLNNLELEN